MKVKLLQSMPGLGRTGDIVEVSDPQARNFLIPKKIAVFATNQVVVDQRRHQQQQAQSYMERKNKITAVLTRISQQPLRIMAKANAQGKLFAAVKTPDIQGALEKQYGIKISTFHCQPDHVKTIGTHQVQVSLDQEPPVPVTIIIEHGA